ncbi:MAG: ABC transporter substrate-binding protein [Thermomicrobiaceae bacterium]
MFRSVSIRWFIPIAVLMFALVVAACDDGGDDEDADVGDTDETEEVADDTDEAADDEEMTEEDDDAASEDEEAADEEMTEEEDEAASEDEDSEESEGVDSDVAPGESEWEGEIVFADYGWDSAIVLNRISQFILEEGYGYETNSVPGETIPLFQGMLSDDVQVSMEIWAAQLEGWDEAVEAGDVHNLGTSIDETVQGWWVPTYVIEGDEERDIEPMAPDLQSVEDLPDYWELFEDPEDDSKGRFMDCIAGWECERVNEIKFNSYGLDETYNRFLPGSGAALATDIVTAYDQGEPWLGYYWGPTWVFGQVDLTMLEEPEYSDECWDSILGAIEAGETEIDNPCAYPAVEVFVGVTDEFYQAAPDVIAHLEQVEFTMDEVSEILAAMSENDLDPDGGAEWFLQEYPDKWHEWVPEEVIEDIEAALE